MVCRGRRLLRRDFGNMGQVCLSGQGAACRGGAVRVSGGARGILRLGDGGWPVGSRARPCVRVALEHSARRHSAGCGGLAVFPRSGVPRYANLGGFAAAALFGGCHLYSWCAYLSRDESSAQGSRAFCDCRWRRADMPEPRMKSCEGQAVVAAAVAAGSDDLV